MTAEFQLHVSKLVMLTVFIYLGFHFSFAEYNNPDNTNFGVLRVMNDDLVQANRGY